MVYGASIFTRVPRVLPFSLIIFAFYYSYSLSGRAFGTLDLPDCTERGFVVGF